MTLVERTCGISDRKTNGGAAIAIATLLEAIKKQTTAPVYHIILSRYEVHGGKE